jgi:hypothetical protein
VALAARAPVPASPTGVARLANREDDVLGQLRKEQHVGDVGVERLLEQGRSLARSHQDDRCLGVLADRRDVVDGQRRAARGVQHDLEMPAGQRAGSCIHVVRMAHELELRVAPEGVTQLGQAFAVPGDEDARLLTCLRCLDGGHRPLLARCR